MPERRPPDGKRLQGFTRKCTDETLCVTRYADGLTDPIVSIDYEEVYAAMKTAYESALNGVEQEDSDRGYSFLEGWSATAVVHGNWMEWQIAELELQFQMNRKNILRKWTIFLAKSNDFEPPSRTALFHVPGSNLYPTPQISLDIFLIGATFQLLSDTADHTHDLCIDTDRNIIPHSFI